MNCAPWSVRSLLSLPVVLSARSLGIALVTALFAVSVLAQSSTPSSRIVRPVDNAVRATLSGTVPKAVKSARDMGALDSAQPLQKMILVLKPSSSQQAALSSLFADLYNKNSASYHKWLTPQQFGAQFGPSDADLAKVEAWLQSQGLNPTGVARGRQWIEFSGSVQQVNAAFATSMHQFNVNGQAQISNASNISIPQALTPVVSGVLSLNNFRKQGSHSNLKTVKRSNNGGGVAASPDLTATDGNGNYRYFLAPGDFQNIYNETPLLKNGVNGAGISIAIAGRSDISLYDVQSFRNIFNLPQNDPNIILNGTDPGFPNNGRDQVESTLDVEWASAAAPGATINFVESASTDTTDGIDLSNAYIVDNAISPIVSVSYGACEALMGPAGNQFYNTLWQQAAAEGITVFVSTGDGGAAECDADLQSGGYEAQGPAVNGPTISGLASTPYNVAVGGTQFNEAGNYSTYWQPNNSSQFASAVGYIPEQAWNESCDPTLPEVGTNCVYGQTSYSLVGGGGGPSNCSQASVDNLGNETCLSGYAKPSWQSGTGVPNDGVRDTPDLSLNASGDDEGYVVCIDADCQTTTLNGQLTLENWGIIGGTSASTPAMAGIMALLEQKYGAFQGQANYVFYRLAAMDSGSSCDSSAKTDPTAASTCNFNDITMGNNSVPGLDGYGTAPTQWNAGVGYDMATGLGTVNAASLVANWGSATAATASTTTLAMDSTTVAHGQPVNVNIHVKPADSSNAIPTGDVALVTDKYGVATDVTLDPSGAYSGTVSNLPGGTYNLTARYAGDGTFGGSTSAPLALTVTPEDSITSVNYYVVDDQGNRLPYAGSTQFQHPLYLTVKVAGKSGQGLPTGMVNILDGGTVLETVPLTSSGVVTIETGDRTGYTLSVGQHNVSVQYVGDSSFNTSTSAAQQIVVQPEQTISYVGISSYDVPANQPVFLTADIPSGYGTVLPTGTFQFYDNGQKLGDPVTIVNGGSTYAQATSMFKLSTLGLHTITAGYSGDNNFASIDGTNPSVAYSSQLEINAAGTAATTTTLVGTPASVAYGQSFTYTVKVTPTTAGGPVPTGTVIVNGGVGAWITLVNGQGTATLQASPGTYQGTAVYQGDSNYAASSSPVITTTVAKFTPPMSLTTTAPYVAPGQQTSLNAVVAGYNYGQYGYANPQGTVQFFDSVNGGSLQAISAPTNLLPTQPMINSGVNIRATLPTGVNVVTAVYSGSQDFNSVTSAPVTITVTPPDFTVTSNPTTLTISAGGSTTDALSVAPILGFSGDIALSCAGGLPAGATCSFSPSTIASGGGQSNLTVTMQGPFTTQASAKTAAGWVTGTEMCGLAGLFLFGFARRRKKVFGMLVVLIAAFGALSGCGGSSTAASTVVVVGSSDAKVASGTAVNFTAQVAGGDKTATGTIAFYDGTTALGTPAAVANGQASLSASSLAVGTHPITAKYSGDSHHASSTSQVYYQAVTGSTTLQVLASSGSTSHTLTMQLNVQ